MNDPRRPDDARLSTADLAAASEREQQRAATREQAREAATQQAERTRPVSDREVAREAQHGHAIADATARRPVTDEGDRPTQLFARNEAEEFRHRWADVQTGFVDEPRQAVERADALVAAAIKRLAEGFAEERARLEQQWSRGDDVSTEDLRVALRRYRGFFDRLLSV